MRAWCVIGLGLGGCSFGPSTSADDAAAVIDAAEPADATPDADPNGPIARWDFDEGDGDVVHDAMPAPLDLVIDPRANVTWLPGALQIDAAVTIAGGAATKISTACQTSGEVTIEAWVVPTNATQSGPARIVTISPNELERNVMLGQEQARWLLRVRTAATDGNGLPPLETTDLIATVPELTHVAMTVDATDRVLYVQGAEQRRDPRGGSFAAWNLDYPITVANEATMPRVWRGVIHRIAIYDRALTAAEIGELTAAGP